MLIKEDDMMYSLFECALVTLIVSLLGLVFLSLAGIVGVLFRASEEESSIMDKVVED